MRRVLGHIERAELDPRRIITHRLPLDQAPHAYRLFKQKQDDCEKVVLSP
jgi:threonine dehydrogenase-like Zn-dependent dehydrogenase